jgi:predicted RNA-binding protein YlxR (DUF448 family)
MKGSPERTCIGCRQVRPKAALVRLTGGDDRDVVVDRRQVAQGRGAYACPTLECLERALAQGRLARALKSPARLSGASAAEILESWRRR